MDKFKKDIKTESDQTKEQVIGQIPFDKYFEWAHDSYTEQIPKLDTKTNAKTEDYSDGMMKRIFNISSMKYSVLPNMLYGNTVVFKLYDITTRKEINFATLFCENSSDIPSQLEKNLFDEQRVGNIVLQHYSVSSSFISCDGEYRGRFSTYSDFIKAKMDYPEIWNEIEAYVNKIIERRQWTIYASYFHGRENENNVELERIIKSNLIAQSFLALSWFHTIYAEYLGLTESHMNETFKEIFFSNLKVDLEFIKELIKKYSEADIEMLKVRTSHIVHPILGSKAIRYIPLGYKMIPLNLREVQYPLKLKYKPWREFLIANRCNDLIINQIAPGFPVTLDWFLIKKSHKGLFDNKSQYERLKHSELAKGVLNLLYEAQRSTYFATTDFGKAPKSDEHIKQWISTKFKRLNDKMRDPIDYSVEEIIMSDVTLAFPSEFVGRTFADTVQLVSKSKIYDAKIGHPFSNYEVFSKYIFEICYNLLAANKRLGVMHGDFHLNNATIGFLYSSDKPNASIIYQIDEEHKFIFPNNGYFACVIDFSRALVNPEEHENLIDLSLPESFKPISDYDKFEATEIQNILHWYLQLFPNKVKQKEELIVMFKNNFSASFKLLTCMDLYMFTARLNVLLQQQSLPVNKKCILLLEKINKLAEMYITTEINSLLADPNYAKKIILDDFPIQTIIKKCFAEFIVADLSKSDNSKKEKIVVTDYYNLDNPMAKSLSKYELFPDVLKYSRYYGSKHETIDIEQINRIKQNTRETYERRKSHSLEHLKFLAHKYLDSS